MFKMIFRRMLFGLAMYWLENRKDRHHIPETWYIYEKNFDIRSGTLMLEGTRVYIEIGVEDNPHYKETTEAQATREAQ